MQHCISEDIAQMIIGDKIYLTMIPSLAIDKIKNYIC